MNSWKLFGTATAVALTVACSTAMGQTCSSPFPAGVGDTPVATTTGTALDLLGICDPGPFGDEMVHNPTWYVFVAPTTDNYTVKTCGSVDFDSRLAVLTDCNNPGTTLACNDDGGASCLVIGSGFPYASSLTFAAVEGQTYYIAVGGYSDFDTGSGSMNIAVAGGGGGTGDGGSVDCGTAELAVEGVNNVSNLGGVTTIDLTGLCNPGPFGDDQIHLAVWFQFTASQTCNYSIDTCNQVDFDSRIAVFTSCDISSVITCNDDGDASCLVTSTGFPYASRVDFAATAGTTYYVAIGGYSDADLGSGTFTITVCAAEQASCDNSTQDCCVAGSAPFCSDSTCCNLVCGFDPFCCGTTWDSICASEAASACIVCGGSGGCGGGTQDCCVAGSAPFCSDADCCSAVCAIDTFCCGTQWDAICASEASALCAICAVACDGPDANYTELELCGEDTNGGGNAADCAAEIVPYPCVIAGTYWSSTSLRDTDWYEFTIGTAQEVTVSLYTSGAGFCGITDTGCNLTYTVFGTSATTGCPRSFTICLPAGTYRAVALMSVFADLPCGGASNDYILEINGVDCDASAPANDECEGAIEVPAAGGTENFDTTFATTSGLALDPSCDEGFGTTFVKDVWYKWTPTCDGSAEVSTCNSATFDTRLAVYTDCFGSLVACNDDGAGCGLTSDVIFPVTTGQTYYIRVGGYSGGGTGSVSFSCVVPITNDECLTATPILNGTTAFSTVGATTSGLALDPSCDEGFGTNFVNDIWFSYVATCNETVTVSTCNDATFDTRLAAYSDCDGTLVACNDDGAGCGLTSSMSFTATQGTTYYIRVGGYSGSGSGNLTISCGSGGGGLTNDDCSTPTNANDGANAFTNVGATSGEPSTSPAECGSFGTGFYNDVWFSYTPSFSGTATFSLCGTASFDTRLELWVGCPDQGGVLVACNDDGSGCTGFTSLMTASVACNTKYLVRIGAYSTTGFGSGTLNITPGTTPCSTPCPGDLDNSGTVDGTDLGLLLGSWGPCSGCAADLDNSGVVDGTDLGLLLGAWGPCS
ncbi:MAG: hypothetical protein U0636_02940 [Phycisphaerales bacterium]